LYASIELAALGRLPSFAADESGHSAAYSLNVGNLRDTGHSVGATPPAAKAEQETVGHLNLNFRIVAGSDG
jgi:hypothetical protein